MTLPGRLWLSFQLLQADADFKALKGRQFDKLPRVPEIKHHGW